MTFKYPLVFMASVLLSTSALADVSVHVLDTNKGLPGKEIKVDFYHGVFMNVF
ncbi:exported hypothetical protein [Vibrio owensii]|uniref:Peptidylprolyl isomerase n=1 Tax=Vibrio owensii TaxID=696485 RepID=A0AAU9QAF1_9VIBR|nr:exported hypothetical protein [Vibrio owensii]